MGRAPTPGRLGVLLTEIPTTVTDGRSLAELGRELEELGVSSIWVADHLFWNRPVPDCFETLATLAVSTERVTLGSGVLQLPLHRSGAVAKSAAFLQWLSRDRFVLGVGVGEHSDEYAAAEVPFTSRGRDLERALDRLAELWSRPPDGRTLAPGSAPPVWIGGRSHNARRRAARRGDGWMPVFRTPRRLARDFELLRSECLDAGRDPSTVNRAVVVPVEVTTGNGGGLRGADWLARLYRLPPERFATHLVRGDPVECTAHLEAYRAVGAEHIIIIPTCEDPAAMVEELQLACTS